MKLPPLPEFTLGHLIFAFGVCWLLIMGFQLGREREHVRSLAFTLDSTSAANDTTRRVQAKALRATRDTMAAYERLVVQMSQRNDALDQELQRARVAIAGLTATIKTVAGTAQGIVSSDSADRVRTAEFNTKAGPFLLQAQVALPRPPATGEMGFSISVDPAHLTVRTECGKPYNGVRPASILVTTPSWLTINVDSATQSREVCNATTKKHVPWWVYPLVGLAGGKVLGVI